MLRQLFYALVRGANRRKARIHHSKARKFTPSLQFLEARDVPAVTAVYVPVSQSLTIIGDSLSNNIDISRNAAGNLLVNGGAIRIRGGTPTVVNTSNIQVFGLAGNDVITLNETQGALPRANLYGGSGNDILSGGSAADMLFGQDGNDIIFGKGGNDFLFGGSGNDVLTGGDADDQVFGESGNDRFVWNPGDDTDLNEGGSGEDTSEVNGGNGAEIFTTTANGTRVRFDRLDPAPFSLDIGTTEQLTINMNAGNDTFSATGNLAALIHITVDGGSGSDLILGSNGPDLLMGGDGDDFIDGNQGNDVAFLGAGNDVFQWDPGDGSDTVEGQDGIDTLRFNGSAANEVFQVDANGNRVRFIRNVGNIVMDMNELEKINVQALGGTDQLIVNSLNGTHMGEINLNLAGTLGGNAGDSLTDSVVISGTQDNDNIEITGSGTSYEVVGLAAVINVSNVEGANDALIVNGLGGNDNMSAGNLPAGISRLTLDGGLGNDTLLGSRGADFLLGGDGDDYVDGQQGDDVAFLGAGNDLFQWEPGDGSDVIEGQDGSDKLMFYGSNASENFDIYSIGERVRLFRDLAAVSMDMNDLEMVELRTLGGSDNVVVGDMTGTDLSNLELALRGPNGGGDTESDAITVNGTQGNDQFGVNGDSGGIRIIGLATTVDIYDHDNDLDRLTLNGQGGDDMIDARSLRENTITLTINGGLGADTIFGSDGSDTITGGDGNDVAFMGNGDDIFVWNPGDDNDIIEGQAGQDEMRFNGSNIAENIDISANGSRVRLFRNIANVLMDTNGVEAITFNALGGSDVVVINDLAGTDVTEVNLNLSASNGSGDLLPDSVIINGTNDDDVILASGSASGISVFGLWTTINVIGSEVTDNIIVNARAGDDVVDASGLTADAIQLTVDAGDGNDVAIGGDGSDVLLGGDGDDVLIGGPGLDLLDGGLGDNILIQ